MFKFTKFHTFKNEPNELLIDCTDVYMFFKWKFTAIYDIIQNSNDFYEYLRIFFTVPLGTLILTRWRLLQYQVIVNNEGRIWGHNCQERELDVGPPLL